LIVEDANLPVGYLYAHTEKITPNSKNLNCKLEVIYTAPEFKGKDLAADIINECIIWTKNKKIQK